MNKIRLIFVITITVFFSSCDEKTELKQQTNVDKPVDKQEKIIEPLCESSLEENLLRLEVKCNDCEVKYSLFTDSGKNEDLTKNKGVWCKELEANPGNFIGVFATKLENGKPINFTLESIEFKEGVESDSVEVRVYYNNKLVKQSHGNGYAGISMLEVPKSKFEKAVPLDLDDCIGENIFEVIQKHSKSSPETINGTNNEFWIVYYKDINVTFTVKKDNDIIVKAIKGRK